MAEARSIQFVGAELKRGVNIGSAIDEAGLHLNLAVTVPPPRACYRIACTRIERMRRLLYYSVFPWGLSVLIGVAAIIVGIVTTAPSDSWFRTGWLAQVIWDTAMLFPWVPDFPHELKVGVLAAWAAIVGFILLTAAQRFLLQLLLTWKGFLYASRKPSIFFKAWFFAVRLLSGAIGGKPLLYAFQSVLPRLPVPDLEATVRRYLRSVRPILDDKDYAEEERAAKKFLADPAEGPRLQWYLTLKAWTSPNYVTDWWESYVYLAGRSPLAVNSNYYVLDAAEWTPSSDQCSRAAMLIWSFLLYRSDLEAERLPPTRVPGGVPLCMHQFHRIFNTTRVPGLETDELRHFSNDESRHIAVLSNGHWYTLDVCDSTGRIIDPVSLCSSLVDIQRDSHVRKAPSEEEGAVASLTAWNRTKWAQARADHFSEGRSRRALRAVEGAAFVMRLAGDEAKFEKTDWTGRGRDLFIGDGKSCWFDKSFNITVFQNGKMGLNAEHSWADAPVMAHVMEVAMILNENTVKPYDPKTGKLRPDAFGASLRERLEKGGISTEAATMAAGCVESCGRADRSKPRWSHLDWGLTDSAKVAINSALADARALSADIDLTVREFSKYGKGFMKKCRVSPDGFVQMALQLAYFMDQGRFDATYESSMTRLFLQGRTETIRACSIESCEFVRAMLDEKREATEKLKLLQDASNHHVTTFRDSMAGRGVDRHLFALYVVSKGKDVDSDFLKHALGRSWRLSTSQQPQQQTDLWSTKDPAWSHAISPGGGFGPVTDDGYGVSYMVAREDSLYFHVSAKKSSKCTDANRFAENIFKALAKMQDILKLAVDAPAKAARA